MESLEKKIGYKFKNPLLLAQALTHPSMRQKNARAQSANFDYQRLEFLGDSVLQYVFSRKLYQIFPDYDEGGLSQARDKLVSRDTLYEIAKSLQLSQYIILAKNEEESGGRYRKRILVDVFEALIGALVIDGGLELCEKLSLNFAAKAFVKLQTNARSGDRAHRHPKTLLQEILQEELVTAPIYHIRSISGPDHRRQYHAIAQIEGQEIGVGIGSSKRYAETEAAKDALAKQIWRQNLRAHRKQNLANTETTSQKELVG